MYFNESKARPLGARLEGGKLQKRVHKSVEQLKRHDPDVRVATEPTKHLLVSNSSVLCGVSLEELETIFRPFDAVAEFIVYPNKRSYSFVSMTTTDAAVLARNELNGLVPPTLKASHQPFVISFVENLPAALSLSSTLRPADLVVEEEFISEEEEKQLEQLILAHPDLEWMKNRGVVHFEHEFDYSSNTSFKPCAPAPPILSALVDRVMHKGLAEQRPDQITVNVYTPGQGIPAHYDTHSAFDDPVVAVSLQSDVVMEFKDGANSARVAAVLLPRRSACLIQGESRYRWKHGIASRQHDVCPLTHRVIPRQPRISITFRKIRRRPCECAWKEYCDWDRRGEMGVPQSQPAARRLEAAYVADVYENIASHFDETRHSNWRAVQGFIDALPRGSVMYDVGCGNGKYLVPKDGLVKMGCDMCAGLCGIAYKKDCAVVRSDALALPYRDESADAAISIAVLHHMATDERRRRLVEEMIRVLKRGGRGLVTVWSMDQSDSEYAKMRGNKDEGGEEEEEEKEKEKEQRLRVHDGKDFAQQDVLVPWQLNEDKGCETFLRFYHVFIEGELASLISSIPGCRVESVVREQGNWIAVFQKE